MPKSYLKRNYGYFQCSSCDKKWESSHVYGKFVDRKYKVEYGQECKDCKIMCMPYRTERLVCKQCGKQDCSCSRHERHVDEEKPHRSDLCGKCKAGRPCKRKRF